MWAKPRSEPGGSNPQPRPPHVLEVSTRTERLATAHTPSSGSLPNLGLGRHAHSHGTQPLPTTTTWCLALLEYALLREADSRMGPMPRPRSFTTPGVGDQLGSQPPPGCPRMARRVLVPQDWGREGRGETLGLGTREGRWAQRGRSLPRIGLHPFHHPGSHARPCLECPALALVTNPLKPSPGSSAGGFPPGSYSYGALCTGPAFPIAPAPQEGSGKVP